MPRPLPEFPQYSKAEQVADGIVHVLGLTGGVLAVLWLFTRTGVPMTGARIAAASVYAAGLIGMLSASALYNLARPGPLKARLRRLDHAMIFVMIAGTYTPFALIALPPRTGIPLCVASWTVGIAGVVLKLVRPNRHGRISLFLYLGMGWMILPVLGPLAAAVPLGVLVLLLAGGVVYSLGAFVHAHGRLPFHNPVWHAMVCVAAALHLAAVARVLSIAG